MISRENFNFTREFEDLVLACLVKLPDRFGCIIPELEAKYFTGEAEVTTATVFLDYFKKYGKSPTWSFLTQLLIEKAGDSKSLNQKTCEDFMKKIAGLDVSDGDAVYERILTFCKERATIIALRKAVGLLNEGKTPDGGFSPMFEEISHIGENINDLGYILHADAEKVIEKVTAQNYGIHTGFPQFDRIWKNGWAPGWLIVPLAPPKRYKSTFCLNLGLNMVGPAIAEDILYYACEIGAEQCFQRVMYNMTGYTEDTLYESPKGFLEKVNSRISELVAGNFVFKHFPIGTATIADLKAHAKMAIKQLGIKPKAIFIDYADTIRASNANEPPHIQQANVYKEAIAFGKEIGACVIMPDRCTKDAVDRKVPSMKAFQGAFAKGGILDIAIGLCSTDKEYASNILRFFNFVNRHGGAYQHWRGKIDPALARIDIGEEIPYDPDEEETDGGSDKKRSGGRGERKKPDLPEDLL